MGAGYVSIIRKILRTTLKAQTFGLQPIRKRQRMQLKLLNDWALTSVVRISIMEGRMPVGTATMKA